MSTWSQNPPKRYAAPPNEWKVFAAHFAVTMVVVLVSALILVV